MKKLKVPLLIALIFLLGAVSGAALERRAAAARFERLLRGGGAALRAAAVDRLVRVLEPDQTQERAIRALLRNSDRRIDAVAGSVQPEIDRLVRETGARLRSVLSPEQARRFDALERERTDALESRAQAESLAPER